MTVPPVRVGPVFFAGATKGVPTLRVAAVWMAASLVVGTVCAWATLRLAFDDFAGSQTSSPLAPLLLLAGALAYLAAPVAIARARRNRAYLALAGLAVVPLAVLALAAR